MRHAWFAAIALLLSAAAYGQVQRDIPATIPDGDAAAGATLFRRYCMTCHIDTAEGPRRLGPTLFGVVGRHTGRVEGFRYSPGNRDADLVWTPQTLFAYLRDPRAFIPGTFMTFAGVRDETERANLIAYLRTLR